MCTLTVQFISFTNISSSSSESSSRRILLKINRVHSFLEHDDVDLVDLKIIKLSLADVKMISSSVNEAAKDTPDAILKMEENAIRKGFYSSFLSQYISEEFAVDKEFSFLVVAILQYKYHNMLSVKEAVSEILELSFHQSMCKVCCIEGETEEEKIKMSDKHNLEIIHSCSGNNDDEESYSEKKKQYKSQNLNVISVPSEPEEEQHSFDWNPFDSSSESQEESLEVSNYEVGSEQQFESTILFNPFDDELESPNLKPKKIVCNYCNADFSNRNNMKQHLIRSV